MEKVIHQKNDCLNMANTKSNIRIRLFNCKIDNRFSQTELSTKNHKTKLNNL